MSGARLVRRKIHNRLLLNALPTVAPGGSQVKTWDSLTFTSAKTVNGVANASIKKVIGVTNV